MGVVPSTISISISLEEKKKKKKGANRWYPKTHFFHTKIIKKFIITSNADSQSSDQDFLRIN